MAMTSADMPGRLDVWQLLVSLVELPVDHCNLEMAR